VCLVVKEYIFLIRTINRDKEILNYNMQNNNFMGSGPINNDSSSWTPVIVYNNAEADKLRILTETKGKTGIYQWTHILSGKKYVGSAIELSKRLNNYYSISYMSSKSKSRSYIYSAILKHGYENFSVSILEYMDISNKLGDEAKKTLILEREQHFLDLLEPEYNILKKAGNSLGYKHSEETLIKISGENHHMLGKTHTAGSKAKMSKPKSEETKAKMSISKGGGTIYVYNLDKSSLVNTFPSARNAAKYFNVGKDTILRNIKSGKLFKGEYLLSIKPKIT
jgi:group I intron endonuclease